MSFNKLKSYVNKCEQLKEEIKEIREANSNNDEIFKNALKDIYAQQEKEFEKLLLSYSLGNSQSL